MDVSVEEIKSLITQSAQMGEVQIGDDEDIFFELGIDSMGLVDILYAIESRFHIEIPPSQVERRLFNTPNKILEYLRSKN
ncbi:acyl carrier protein [Fibrobacterota bacterium]